MARTARDVLDDALRTLAPGGGTVRLVPEIASGRAPRAALAAFALEQHHVITSDRRSFAHLAERAGAGRQPLAADFFDHLARGEDVALERLGPLAAACGLDGAAVRAHEPRAGCQAYPAYAAWLALCAEPVDVVVALSTNFAAWGGYCATVGLALREHYGFDDAACGFFDFFATPDPEGAQRTLAAVGGGLTDGRLSEPLAHRYGRLLRDYESMFWETLSP
ncbi:MULTISPECIES: transcriptional regulator [Streptomyces]|uniref:Transcriptional regulator n=1 Tax=Streptomyces griseocarneus TaxID=51201 RepID=A0ABX7RRQ8_9ACTN|nr:MULTISPECIES: transcriptional regulator [Streptomyces]QSY50467.1 transcriptional regulator [Streptomyces griseocarneus]